MPSGKKEVYSARLKKVSVLLMRAAKEPRSSTYRGGLVPINIVAKMAPKPIPLQNPSGQKGKWIFVGSQQKSLHPLLQTEI